MSTQGNSQIILDAVTLIIKLDAENKRLIALLPPEDSELPTWKEAATAWKALAEAAEAKLALGGKSAYHCPKCDSWFSEKEVTGERA